MALPSGLRGLDLTTNGNPGRWTGSRVRVLSPPRPGPSPLHAIGDGTQLGRMGSAKRLTGTAGRWSAAHPWLAIGVWLGCVLVLVFTGRMVGTHQLSQADQSSGQ